MNIAFLTSYPLDVRIGSGVIRTLLSLHRALHKLGHPATLIAPQFTTDNPLSLANHRLRFNRYLKTMNFSMYEAVIGSDFDGYTLPEEKTPPYFVFNGGLLADIVRFEKGRIARILNHLARREKQNLEKAALVFVPSRYSAKKIHSLYGISPDKIRVIPLGVDYEGWQQLLSQEKKLPQPGKTILCVARQYPRKGIHDLIRAFALLRKTFRECRLWIVGGGPQMQENRRLMSQLGLDEVIRFYGDVTERGQLAALFRNSDLFCLPSYHETFGLVYLEAMASGLPVVAYQSTAVPEVVSEESGLLVPAGDITLLAGSMRRLLENPDLSRKLGLAGREIAQKMTWRASASQLIHYLQNEV